MTEELNGKAEGVISRRQLRETPKKRPLKRYANAFVLVAAVGIVGTVAIPAYAFNPSTQSHVDTTSMVATTTRANAQSADITAAAKVPTVTHDGYQATSITAIDSSRAASAAAAAAAAKLAAQREAAAKAAAAKAASYSAAYTGPTAAQYLSQAPSSTSYSLAAVFATAQKYIGDPYQLGGSTPAGFDCSGFVMFVYAQFGVSLPHSASEIANIGQTVSLAQAQPGDVIALNDGSHVGFYAGKDSAGNVLILDAPKPGGHVSIRELWTTAYHIQHIGSGA